MIGALGLVACGGDDDSGDTGIDPVADASTDTTDGGGTPAACNPVEQTGCDAGEKCAQLTESEDPFLARTTCVPDGDVEAGQECTTGEAGPMGYDDCVAGYACNGVCVAICTIGPPQAGCGEDESCVLYENTFDDIGDGSSVGLCAPACDPVAQTLLEGGEPSETPCPNDGACFLSPALGTTSCARVPEPAVELKQDDECYGPQANPTGCYLNGCAAGYIPFWNNPNNQNSRGLCTAFCNPVDTFGGATPEGDDLGDPEGVQCDGVLVAGGQGQGDPAYTCRFISWFADATPDEWGICAANGFIELGLCSTWDIDAWVAAFEDADEDGEPDTPNYCTDGVDPNNMDAEWNYVKCPQGCISLTKLEELFPEPAMRQRAAETIYPQPTAKGLLLPDGQLVDRNGNIVQ